MDKYDKVNSFLLEKDKFLFFDIFTRNNELILICPIYSDFNINYDNIKIIFNNKKLKDKKNITYIEKYNIPIVVIIFIINNVHIDDINNITIQYNQIETNLKLKYENFITKYELALTTLFKDDYELINIFYPYYINQGIQHFYMYYNGILTDEIKTLYNKNNITLIEWNFIYWNNTELHNHHAQSGQIHHALYKYGKVLSKYLIFNDLDEYMYNPNNKIIDLVLQNNVDTFVFSNYWCITLDNKIPNVFPKTFYKNSFENIPYDRSKCIHKTNSHDSVNIHQPRDEYIKNISIHNNNNIFYHFSNWSNINNNRNMLTDPIIVTIDDDIYDMLTKFVE